MKKTRYSKNKTKAKVILLIINIFCSILLIASVFCFNVSPTEHSFLILLPSVFLSLLIINACFLLLWIIIKWKFIFISIVALLFSLKVNVIPYESYFSSSNENDVDLKIMSYNVQCFGLYEWEDVNIKKNIIKIITDEKPDVLCLQEAFWVPDSKNFITIDSIKKTLGYKYDKCFAVAKAVGNQNFGLVIISRYPIINSDGQKFEKTLNAFMYADILKDEDTIRIYNLHLESLHFGKNDYETIETISDTLEASDINKISNLYIKYLKSYKKRAIQSDIVRAEIDSCKKQKFVCGDFNDFALSYTFSKIKGDDLKDTYLSRGKITDYSWHNDKLKIRIDYILYGKGYECKSYKTIKKAFSDHFPVVAEFSRKEQQKK